MRRSLRQWRIAATAAAALHAGACTESPSPSPPPAPTADFERMEALAPIESAELIVRESFPPQYALRIVSGLPSGCAWFERIDVARRGDAVDVTVWNTVPAAGVEIACTMIYGTANNTVELGTDFTSGQRYAVIVNGEERLSFTAQ